MHRLNDVTQQRKYNARYFKNLKKLEAWAAEKCEAHFELNLKYAECINADESKAPEGVGAELDEADESQAQKSQAIDVDMAEESQLL